MRAIDESNEDPKYWEKVLKGLGLGLRQLGMHEKRESDITRTDPGFSPDLISLEELERLERL
jgi:hypothetical protein